LGDLSNAKPIIDTALRKWHVNGAEIKHTLRCGKVLALGAKKIPLGGVQVGAGPPNVNLGPPNISETTRARKMTLKTPLDMSKYTRFGYKKNSAREYKKISYR